MSQIRYKVNVFSSGVQSTTGAVAFTLQTSQLRAAPTLGGQLVRAALGRVESQPWKLKVVDAGNALTAHLANTSGRLNLLGRLVQFQSSLDSTGTYTNLTVGRLTDVSLDIKDQTYDVTVNDERFLERDLLIFSRSNTATVLPRGTVSGFMNLSNPLQPTLNRWFVPNINNKIVFVTYTGIYPGYNPLSVLAGAGFMFQTVIDDIKPNPIVPNNAMTAGNFQTLRFHNIGDGNDYEVAGFQNPNFSLAGIININDPLTWLLGLSDGENTPVSMLLVWPNAQPAALTSLQGYLYLPGHISSNDLPLHIGGITGLHPGKVARNCYDGIYNPPGSTTIKLRYSTAAFDAWQKDPSYGRVWFRITAPQSMATFLEQRIYGPYGMLPLINTSGQISPKRAWPPSSSSVPSILPTITSTNILAGKHPTFEHGSREAITAIRARYDYYGFQLDKDYHRTYTNSADGFTALTHETTRLSDRVTNLGRQEAVYSFGAIYGAAQLPIPNFRFNSSQLLPNAGYAETVTSALAQHVFARFADGPLYVNVQCLRSIDSSTHGTVQPGDYVKLNLATWPNPITNTRGGNRILQVLQRGDTPTGPTFRLLDYGATGAVLAVPGLALAATTNGDSSRHSFKLTVSSVPAGAKWHASVAMTTSTGGSVPASSSPAWKWLGAGTTASLTLNVGQRPSNTKHFVKVRSIKTQKVLSAWSSAPSRITSKIPGPTNLTTAAKTRGTVTVKWTNGSSLYASEIMIDTSTASALGSSDRVDSVPPGTTRYLLEGLANAGKHKIGVRHDDPWGGFSTMATAIISGTSALARTTSPAVRGIHFIPVRF